MTPTSTSRRKAEPFGEREAWLAENEDAIHAYNRFVEKHGVFGDESRRF
jgi:post-segregation antitoxin (ccd killing protein)